MGRPIFALPSKIYYPFPLTDPQITLGLLASSMDPSDLPCQTASRSDPPFFPQCTGQTHRPIHRQTDGYRESLTTKAAFAVQTATRRPNNNKLITHMEIVPTTSGELTRPYELLSVVDTNKNICKTKPPTATEMNRAVSCILSLIHI